MQADIAIEIHHHVRIAGGAGVGMYGRAKRKRVGHDCLSKGVEVPGARYTMPEGACVCTAVRRRVNACLNPPCWSIYVCTSRSRTELKF